MRNNEKPTQEEIREYIKSDQLFRTRYFEHNFEEFFIYHWGWDLKWFQRDWIRAMERGENVLMKTFRGSRKTTIARGYAVWCIVYNKHDYIVVQSFEDVLSAAWVTQVAIMLMEETILEDYGALFPFDTKREDFAKKSVSNFDTTNGVKIESKSLGQTLRGANVYKKKKGAKRPTLLFLDDIDVASSVANIEIINKNEKRISGETIGAMDPLRRQIVFSGNVINEDGIVPRFIKKYKGKKRWNVFELALMDEYENPESNVWPEVFTADVIAQLKVDEGSDFLPNYLLVAYVDGQVIIPKSLIRTVDRYPAGCRITVGIDPAFSLKTTSDALALVVTAHLEGNKYVLAYYELVGNQKQESIYRPFIKQIYNTFNVSLIRIESNNGGELIGRQLQQDGMAVEILTATKDKITRLREKESDFTQGRVLFLPGTEELQERLGKFPKVKRDDIVDAMVYSLDSGNEIFVGGF